MEDHELQALRPPDSGGQCGAKQCHEGVREENGGSEITEAVRAPLSSPSIKLALSVHPDSTDEKFDRSVTMDQRTDCRLTPIQSLELRLQTHIYKHLAGGLPLPLHLAIPLWRNVATYLGSTNSAIYQNDQSCVEFGSEELKHKSMTDPEPGRCRRTDGKKWRCRKNSIPEQKYCERHIHRGRQCSRKPVEECEINSPSIATAPSRILHSKSESKSSIFSTPVKLITTSIVTESTANLTRCNPITFAVENEITASAINNDEGYCNKGLTDFHVNKSGNGPNKFDNGQSSLTLGLGFSPRSVLQVLGKNSACFVSKTSMIEPEPGRCRRTDGKKWRCSRDVIPKQKYCGIHMHRGSIKKFKSYHNVVSSIPNTNLSISIRPSHRSKRIEEKNSSSSGSETTISDTTILC